MNQKTALTIAAALTAFMLVIGGGLVGRMTRPAAAAFTPVATEIQTLMVQREAEYQARLDEANKALAEAYAAQNAATRSQADTATMANNEPQVTEPQAQITSQEAMSAAVIAVPGAKILSIPELVNFQGILAYEVKLDKGLVYIDASNGAVLYNGVAQVVTAQSPLRGDDHDDEHEQEGDDD